MHKIFRRILQISLHQTVDKIEVENIICIDSEIDFKW